jgi:hypothetical protein
VSYFARRGSSVAKIQVRKSVPWRTLSYVIPRSCGFLTAFDCILLPEGRYDWVQTNGDAFSTVLAPRRHDFVRPPELDLARASKPDTRRRRFLAFPTSRRKVPLGEGTSFIKRRCFVPSYRRPLARFGAFKIRNTIDISSSTINKSAAALSKQYEPRQWASVKPPCRNEGRMPTRPRSLKHLISRQALDGRQTHKSVRRIPL